MTVIGLWLIGNWRLSFVFSKTSFKSLFGYGSKLLAAGVYSRSLQEVYNLVIGKAYTASELGFFVQAKKLSEKPSGILSSVLQKVSFPILSSLQKDEKRMIRVYSRMIKMAAFITFPAMTLLAILAEPIILLLLTEKWLPVVPLLQWLCFMKIVYPISVINMNILNAVGRSDLFLKVDLVKFPMIVITLIITIPISLLAVVIGQFINSVISYFINAYMPGKLFGYGPIKQFKDIIPVVVITLIMAVITLITISLLDSDILKILIGLTVAFTSYLSMAYFMKSNELNEILDVIKNRLWSWKSS